MKGFKRSEVSRYYLTASEWGLGGNGIGQLCDLIVPQVEGAKILESLRISGRNLHQIVVCQIRT